jgi:Zn-dependent protease
VSGEIDMQSLGPFLVWYLVFVFSTTFHEFSHAFVAYKGGDPTAYEGGIVTLDPIPHIRRSPFGMVLVPIISFFAFGWMIGWASAPYNPQWARRHPRRHALMSLAGPAANILLATIAFIALRVLSNFNVLDLHGGGVGGLPADVKLSSPLGALAMALWVMLNLNVLLGIFNLMPVPPLDGSGVVEGAAPNSVGRLYDKLREVPAFEFLGMIIAWRLFPYVADPAVRFVRNALYS